MKATNLFIKNLFMLLFFAALPGVCLAAASVKKPFLVILLMVKNEKEAVIPTLETYLSDHVLSGKPDTGEVAYILQDTGSTDGTERLAEEFFKKHHIKHYQVHQDPEWLGFGRTRNKGLALARALYPDSTFILSCDAEWYMRNFDELIDFCRQEAEKEAAGIKLPAYYRVWMRRSGTELAQQRLFTTHDDVEFDKRRVHECPNKYANGEAPKSAYFELGCSRTGYENSRKRWPRDVQDLKLDLAENPKDPRTAFYLAVTYLWLEDYRNAYTYFKLRITLQSFPEEDFFAYYYLGRATEALASTDSSFTWDEALKYYLQAFSMRPHRADPLIRIAQHYLSESNHALSFLFARRACDLPYPTSDVLPYDKYLYDFTRHEILSRSSWYVGEFEIGETAAKKAIEGSPNSPYLYRNLAFYWDRQK